jgi:hypothetical protein
MGTLTSYVGAIFVGRPLTKGSTGFCWINISGVNVVVSIAFEFSIQPFISVLPQVYSYRQNAKGK